MFDDGSEIRQSDFMDKCMVIWLQAADVLGLRPITVLGFMTGVVTVLSTTAMEQ